MQIRFFDDKFTNAAAGGQRQFFFHSPQSTVYTYMGKNGQQSQKRPRSTSIRRGLDNRFGLPSTSSTARPPPKQSRPEKNRERVLPGSEDATEEIAGDGEGGPVDMVGPAEESSSQHASRCKGKAQHCARCRLGAAPACLTLQPCQFSFQCSKVFPTSVEGSNVDAEGFRGWVRLVLG